MVWHFWISHPTLKIARDEMGKHKVGATTQFSRSRWVISRVVVRNGMPHPPCHVEEFEVYEDVPDGCARLKAANFLWLSSRTSPTLAAAPRVAKPLTR